MARPPKPQSFVTSTLLLAAGVSACRKRTLDVFGIPGVVDADGKPIAVKVTVREPTVREHDQIFTTTLKRQADGTIDAKLSRATGERNVEAVLLCTLDENGGPAFEEAHRDTLLASPAEGWIKTIATAIFELASEGDDMGKGSSATAASNSSPTSPSNPEGPSPS